MVNSVVFVFILVILGNQVTLVNPLIVIFDKNLALRKFLIIRFSSIGDIVLTTPVVRCLKQQLPDAEVHYLTKASFLPVIEANPYIDQTIYNYGKKLVKCCQS